MSAALAPPAEASDRERLGALATYGILDTPPEQGFDDIVDLAAEICATPVALVSLVAGERQWFKARVGFEPCEIPLDQSICAHALARPDLLVIPDLTQDPRTRENTLVTGEPHLRFYAGAPLETPDGQRLGTLCVIDDVPRPEGLTPSQASSLRKLAGQVVAQMELRRAVKFRDAALAEQRATLLRHDALAEAQDAVSAAKGDLDASLDALVAGAMRAVPQAEGGVIEMREGDELVYHAVRGSLVPHKGLRLPLRGSLSGHSLRIGLPVSCPDVLLDDRVKRDVVGPLGMRSALCVPVMRAGTAIGVLKLQSGRVDAFTDGDLEFVRLFAGTVAAGLAQAGEAEAQRLVRKGRDRYRAVFNSAIDYAIIVMGLDGRVDDWNEGATRILGWSPAEMVERPADVFFTPEDRANGIAAKEMQAALEHGRGIDERWHVRKDGTRFWANGEMMALRDEAGTAIGFLKILRDRTEQRDAAARLQESEAFLRSVLDSSADCIKVLDLDACLGFMNQGGQSVMEVDDFDGVAGMDWTEFWDEPGKADARAAVAAALAGGVGRFTGPACTLKGTPKWWDVQVTPIRDGDGAVARLLAVSRDITASRQAEEALVASETRYRDLYDSIDAGFCVIEVKLDPDERPLDYRFMEVNPAFERQSGLRDVLGKWMRELAEGHEEHWFEIYDRIARGGVAERFEHVASALGNQWFEVYAYPFGEPGSHQVAILFNDITARRRTEDALRASEASQRSILETVPVGILFAEAPSGRIVGGNTRIEEILGHPVLPSSNVEAYREWHAVHEDGRPVEAEEYPLARVIRGEAERAELQVRYRRGNGSEVWIDIVAVPVRGQDGAVTGAVAAVSDIDARRRAEEQRDLLNNELSHRMKNLLAMVQAIAANTLRGATDVEAAKEVLADRLITLGKAHDLLLGGAVEHAALEQVVRGGVGLQDDGTGRVAYRGPPVEIGGRAALALALMTHELATNAAKYGALSTPGGRVDVAWSLTGVEADAVLSISWCERGGPPVSPPTRKGFGSRLIERGLVSAVDGRIALTYPPEGVRCVVEAPLRNFQDVL
ncbi:PAS domain S-box-containing protein [Methylobacterium phyllostachyos]|uniref:Blue-light-activated histidine kinase n=1 Tax=Methylobacterium phyllostachyos TaxID=582672 RepID=A0A1G9WY66_9HYPH|nr:PAS domain S-box protein [Methylobacterium phyllostachyos]SDM89116.1 PAS domain S-box-containing protein [Methylobacterium phyllostachyos]